MKRIDFINKYEKHIYLGDSVYARFDGYNIWIETMNGLPDDPSNSICLEPAVIDNLLKYRRQLYLDAENMLKDKEEQ